MFQNDNCNIDGIFFDKRSLLDRCLEIYWFRFSFNLLLGILLFLLVYPNMLSVAFVRWNLMIVIAVNLIILKRIYNISLKINRIFKKGKIIKSNVITEFSYERASRFLFVGQYHIHSMYFDSSEGVSIPFFFDGHSDRPVDLLRPFKQGGELSDIKTINVLVNDNDYNEYFVLFREELNIDVSRKKYFTFIHLIDYILWYSAIVLMIWFTH